MSLKEHSQRDLVVRPNRYAFILDETKGEVRVHVGPLQASLSPNEKPVMWDEKKKKFVDCDIQQAVRSFVTAPEGWYISLKNPSNDLNKPHPLPGTKGEAELNVGRKINIHGPANFPLWPGQMARAIQGHRLRNNQYLVARVYNAEAASRHQDDTKIESQDGNENAKADGASIYPEDFRMGELFIIKGTDVGFYMPPTGIEIIAENKDSNDPKYVREAVTLERLEYCILLDQNGNKRYVYGPDVVFPKATETFVESNGNRKFRAIELNEQMGLYVKVIADYMDGDTMVKQGDELFITGRDTKIYYPRHEHSIIKYGDQSKHFATVIPEGEARYVLEKNTGKIELVRGPKTFLPDPRTQVIVRRVLNPRTIELLFPGNQEALQHNMALMALQEETQTKGGGGGYVSDNMVRSRRSMKRSFGGDMYSAEVTLGAVASAAAPMDDAWAQESAGDAHFGHDMARGTNYNPPRTITLDSKYDGAVAVQVWSGYAMLLVSKSGRRRVIEGPQTVLLEYDETPEMFTLSKGMPKGTKGKRSDVFLRTRNNRVSDKIDATTKDFVDVDISLSFRVSFENTENQETWFSVENYTQLLSDHMGSVVRNAVKKYGIEEFNSNAIDIIRETVLGPKPDGGERPGKFFQENSMRIYDVEVLRIEIQDPEISKMLQQAQRDAVKSQIQIALQQRHLDVTKRTEEINRQVTKAKHETTSFVTGLRMIQATQDMEAKLQEEANVSKVQQASNTNRMAHEQAVSEIKKLELARNEAVFSQEFSHSSKQQEQKVAFMEAETASVVAKFQAISPEFQATLNLFGDRVFSRSLMENLGAHALLRGNSTSDVFAQLVNSLPGMENVLKSIPAVTNAITGTGTKTTKGSGSKAG